MASILRCMVGRNVLVYGSEIGRRTRFTRTNRNENVETGDGNKRKMRRSGQNGDEHEQGKHKCMGKLEKRDCDG